MCALAADGEHQSPSLYGLRRKSSYEQNGVIHDVFCANGVIGIAEETELF